MKNPITLLSIIAAMLILLSTNTLAQDSISSRLMAARSVKCQMDSSATWAFDGSIAATKNGLAEVWTYDSINLKKGTARLIGKKAATDVVVQATPMGLTFTENKPLGLTVDTIFAGTKTPGKYNVVSSLHMDYATGQMSYQYHGQCWILE